MGVYPRKVAERCRTNKFGGTQSSISVRSANFDCGCIAGFSISEDVASGKVAARFHTNGCGYMVATADLLAEVVDERQLTGLHGLNQQELIEIIEDTVGELPESRRNCAVTCIESLRAAFGELRVKRIEEFRGERALICTCFGVSEDTIETLVADREINTTDDVANACNAGSGCGSCRMLIQEMLDRPNSDF